MRRDDSHTHPCCHCGKSVECSGEQIRNFDGWPETICTAYHLQSGALAEWACEDCDTSRCSDCGEVLNVARHDDACPKATAV